MDTHCLLYSLKLLHQYQSHVKAKRLFRVIQPFNFVMCATHCSKFIHSQGLGHHQQVSHQARITAIAIQSWQGKNYAPLTLVVGRLRLLTACFRCRRLRPHHLSDLISAYFWSDCVELNGARIIDLEDAFLNPEFCVDTSICSAKGSVGIGWLPS